MDTAAGASASGPTTRRRPAFRYEYRLTEPVRLYSGQSLIGTGATGVVDWGSSESKFIGRQGPYLTSTLFLVPDAADPAPEAVFVVEDARQVTIRNVDIKLAAKRTIEVGIDIRNSSDVLLSNVHFDSTFNHPIRLTGGRGNWIEGCRLSKSRGLVVPDDAEDTTLWSVFASSVIRLGGVNAQAWFSIIEPEPAPAHLPHQVVLAGVGSCVFAPRVEGTAAADLDAARDRGLIRVERGSDFAQFSAGHTTPGGFHVVVEADCASTLIRHVPTRGHGSPQGVFELGLTNLLRDSGFHRCGAAPHPWQSSLVEWQLDNGTGRAYDSSLRLRPQAPDAAVWQHVTADSARGLDTVADTTFAAACWVRATQPGTVLLRVEEIRAAPGAPEPADEVVRAASSNAHPGDGDYHYLSVLLHTTRAAQAIRFKLVFSPLAGVAPADLWVSEPMLVRGAYVPPHHGLPLPEGGGRLNGPARFAGAPFEVRLGAVVDLRAKLASIPLPGDHLMLPASDYMIATSRVLARGGRLSQVVFGHQAFASGLSAAVALDNGAGETFLVTEDDARGGRLARPLDLRAGARCCLAVRRTGQCPASQVAVGATLLLEREV